MIDLYIQEVDRGAGGLVHAQAAGGDEDPREDPRPRLAPARNHGAGARSGASRARHSRNAAESAAGPAHLVAHGRSDVAHRRRYQHRFQPLYQAHDAGRGLRLDPALPGSTTRAKAGATPRRSSTGGSTMSWRSRSGRPNGAARPSGGSASRASSGGCATRHAKRLLIIIRRKARPRPCRAAFFAFTILFARTRPYRLPRPQPTADVQTAWRLLDYVAVDYGGAVQDGKIVSASEYAEMREFSGSVAEKIASLPNQPAKPKLVGESARFRSHGRAQGFAC